MVALKFFSLLAKLGQGMTLLKKFDERYKMTVVKVDIDAFVLRLRDCDLADFKLFFKFYSHKRRILWFSRSILSIF